MEYNFLSIIATFLVFFGYFPEFYTTITKKSNDVGNIYIWLIWTISSLFSVVHCILIEEYYVMTTHIVILLMNFLTFLLKYYYLYYYKDVQDTDEYEDEDKNI